MGTPKGPFMGDDLVSCSKTKPAEEEDAGLGWAGIEPPLPAESCPKPDAACKAAAKACDADGSCKKAKAKGGTKGIVDVGCHGGKKGLNAFFAWTSDCCDPSNIGFSDNTPMFKMQITSMPVYKNSGTNGRFKANRGAGSVCTMVKSLASGMASGDDGGVFLQKSSMKEVKAKHAAAHKAADAKTGKLHKGLVKAVVSDKSTKHAKAAAGANGKAASAAAAVEKKWAKKEAGFRAKARALNKKQRAAAKSMEGGVKSARKALMADTAKSIKEMHEAAVAEKKLMKKHAAFQKKMHGIQTKMASESAAAKKASAARLAKYKKEMAANAKAIAAGKAKSKAIANAMKAANAKLAKDQAGINNHYKATMKALAATNAKNQNAMNAAQ